MLCFSLVLRRETRTNYSDNTNGISTLEKLQDVHSKLEQTCALGIITFQVEENLMMSHLSVDSRASFRIQKRKKEEKDV